MDNSHDIIYGLAEVALYLTNQCGKADYSKTVEDACSELSKHRWIPVSERLPDPLKDVLVFAKAKEEYDMQIGTGSYIYPNIGWMTRGLPNGACVEYWMPLPEPPQEG